jgi:hypothetical protein
LGAAPTKIELLEPLGSKRRNAFGVTIHTDDFRDEDVEPWGEFFVTSPARTLADLSKWQRRASAVVALDFALGSRALVVQRVTKDAVEAALAASTAVRNRTLAEAVVSFADGASGSPGESVSRVLLDDFGFPPPLLQVRHAAPPGLGRWFYTDFEWPQFGLAGEFDGRAKFLKPEYLAGRNPSQVAFDEKMREDALRKELRAVARWTWDYLVTPILLRDLLVKCGLPAARLRRSAGRPW